MKKFDELLKEAYNAIDQMLREANEALEEGLGNLAEIPSAWLSKLNDILPWQERDTWGQDSQFQLVKGGVNRRGLNKAMREIVKMDDALFVFLKLNDEPFMLLAQTGGYGKKMWKALTAEGEKLQSKSTEFRKTRNWGRTGGNKYSYHTVTVDKQEYTKDSILYRIEGILEEKAKTMENPENMSLDVYVVTTDKTRLAKKAERGAARKGSGQVSNPQTGANIDAGLADIHKKAVRKFLKNKVGEYIQIAIDEVKAEFEAALPDITSIIDAIESGKDVPSISFDERKFKTALDKLNGIKYLIMKIEDIVREGKIKEKDWRDQNMKATWYYQRFLDAMTETKQ